MMRESGRSLSSEMKNSSTDFVRLPHRRINATPANSSPPLVVIHKDRFAVCQLDWPILALRCSQTQQRNMLVAVRLANNESW